MRWRVVLSVVLAIAGLTLVAPAFANHGPGDRLDCDDFRFQEEAQAHFDAHPGDPDRLDDAGVPGVACDDLPFRGGPPTSPGSTLADIVPTPSTTSGGTTAPGATPAPVSTTAPTTTSAPATTTTTRAPTPSTTAAPASTTTTTPPATPPTTAAAPSPLPNTGPFSGAQLGVASALIWLGLALLAASRITLRRRPPLA